MILQLRRMLLYKGIVASVYYNMYNKTALHIIIYIYMCMYLGTGAFVCMYMSSSWVYSTVWPHPKHPTTPLKKLEAAAVSTRRARQAKLARINPQRHHSGYHVARY